MSQETKLITTMAEAETVLRQVAEAQVVTYDTETSGLDFKRNHIVAHVVKPINCPSYYVPVRHAGGGNVPGCKVPQTKDGWRGDLHPFEIQLAKIAASKPRRWVGHFLDFDLKLASRAGIELVGPLEDTWINASIVNTHMRSFSLDAVARYNEVTEKKGEELYEHIARLLGEKLPSNPRDIMEHYWRMPGNDPIVFEYGAGDGISTEEVWRRQQLDLDEDNEIPVLNEDGDQTGTVDHSLRTVWGVECRLIRTLHRMTYVGVRIDEDRLDEVDRFFASKSEEIGKKFPPGFKSNKPTHLKSLLAQYIDDPLWPRTPPSRTFPQGQLQFNEDALERIPEGRDIVAQRKYDHARSTFTIPMKEQHVFNGRVHTTFNQMKKDDFGVITGRLSSSVPNLTAVPRRDKLIGVPYRSVFIPEEGHIWSYNDYKQQEYVVFTDYTRIPILMEGYCSEPPVDIHQAVADILIAAGIPNVTRDPMAKRINLAILYGMGAATLATRLHITENEARHILNVVNQALPGIKGTQANPGFMKKAEKVAKRRGFVFTYLKRRQRFPDARLAHKAGNAIIQGSSADITKLKMVEIDDYFESENNLARLMLSVHDSLDWSQPEGMDYLSEEAIKIMTSFGENDLITMGVPMRTDSNTGKNWSEATYG